MRKIVFVSTLLPLFSCMVLNAETASLSVTGTSEITDPIALTFLADGSGTLSPLGSTSISLSGIFNPTVTDGRGQVSFDFGSGNTLTGTFDVPSIFFVPSGSSGSGTGEADITGGTGIYSGYTGELNLTGDATSTGDLTADFALNGSGNIYAPSSVSAAPEPASVAMLILCALVFGIWRSKGLIQQLSRGWRA